MSRPFIRRVPTASGATAVQIITKRGSGIARIEHIGPAHDGFGLRLLIAGIQNRPDGLQPRLDLLFEDTPKAFMEKSYSELLWKSLCLLYDEPGFDGLLTRSSSCWF